jgi:outer membrane PBP1 activator LpoA protein
MEDFLDMHSFNKITVEHKVAEFELLKLKETVPTYADEIKENLSKNLARDIIKKTTFTKKHNVDSDTHHFLGRVWVFTEDELKNLIKEARNV